MGKKVLTSIIVGVLSIAGGGVALATHGSTTVNLQEVASHSASAHISKQNTPVLTGKGLDNPGANTTKSSTTTTTTTPSKPTPLPTYTYTPTQSSTAYSPSSSSTPDNSECLSEKQAALAPIQDQFNQTQDQINNAPATAQARTAGYFVTEAQLEALINQIRQPLYAQLSSIQAQYNQTAAKYSC